MGSTAGILCRARLWICFNRLSFILVEGVLFVASALGSPSTLGLSVHLRRPELRRVSPLAGEGEVRDKVCFSGVPTTGAVSFLVKVRRRVDDGEAAGASALVNVNRRGDGDAAAGAEAGVMPVRDEVDAVLLRLPLPFLPADP